MGSAFRKWHCSTGWSSGLTCLHSASGAEEKQLQRSSGNEVKTQPTAGLNWVCVSIVSESGDEVYIYSVGETLLMIAIGEANRNRTEVGWGEKELQRSRIAFASAQSAYTL